MNFAKPTSKVDRATRLTKEPISPARALAVREKIVRARVDMLKNMPFFGLLACRLQVFAADQWCPTMAVDGKYMYYNHAFVEALEPDELIFVLAHEVEHLVFDHVGRGKANNFNPKVHNIACDYVVNDDLIQANVGRFPTTIPGLHDIKYRGWASEDVYEDLMKQKDTMDQLAWEKLLKELLDELMDEHLDSSGQGNGNESCEPTASGPGKIADAERDQLKAELKQAIVMAAQQSQDAGNLPAGMQRVVQELIAPKINWRQLLQCHLNSLLPDDYSYVRPSRKGWNVDAVLPGMTRQQQLEIAIAIDMSGSITDENAREFLSEIKGIMEQYQNYSIEVMCFDTRVYNDQLFLSDNGDDIRTYQPMGGGGTDASCIVEHLKEKGTAPTKLVVFTDGYVSSWGDENYIDTVWVLQKGSTVQPPFGVYANMD